MSQIEFTRVNNDINGNPRYVVHYLNLIPNGDKLDLLMQRHPEANSDKYSIALKRAKTIGGKKFHNKQYGGGIVFQSYSLPELEKSILNLKNS